MSTDTDLVSESLPAYEIGGELGRGGWGVVLSGKHRALGRPVAIKQLPPSFAADPNVRRRFTAEGRLLASLDHPHVVPVYDFVEHDGLCLLVMELLPGGTVWSTFTRVGFNAHSAVAVALACAAGLKAAHDRGILHRDVKPENLMFAASGAVKVTDFGIAKVVGGDETLATRAGDVLGTPSYIAPEQARGRELSPATDVYALSTMLYELLAGALPFPEAGDAMAQLFQHAFDSPIQLLDVAPMVPDPIAEVVMRGLATDPADRYPTAEDFGIALAGASTGRWGPGWLAAEGIPVMGADTIVTAAGIGIAPSPTLTEGGQGEHPSLPVTRPLAKSSAQESEPFATPPPTTEPTATQRPPRTESGEPRATEPPPPVVRPSITVHTAGVRLADVSDTDLVPVRTVVEIPPARVPLLIAAGLAVAAIGVALLGLGAPVDGQTPPPGRVSIAGIDPAVAEPVVDLTEPLTVAIAGPVPADTAFVTLGVLDREVKTQSAPLLPAPDGAVATLPPLGGGYVAAGEFTGELSLMQAGQVTDTWRFPVDTTQPATTTAVAVGVAAVFLFSIAYLESFLRSLRRGRRRISGTIGVPVSAAALAVSVVGAVWVLLGRQPTVTTLVVTVSLAAAAGLAAAIGASRVGRRRRYRRAARRTDR
ncbi:MULTISPECIES: serine/threonine-protein kinase [Rhodococcus]|uniref:non-specific serine/threonine protein kinase n=1 Tax=Rhodococcus opacus RKJ300 = JCM 13270 TaxID=1165867 RepID=I0WTQ1_RHOOP|nr:MULTISPECIES: serine/threonine-protein kinase [Rhodococcus]EID79767.1 protein kinase [Rhodococcus opacus RKJ300 = JCM 13270]KAF0957573.1 Serine/threonine-protein kinase PknD [Rhodococcus sp. T7]KAF0961804.1 Serine/threonine-protein kinase PknD [Rhodococcus sp. T7]QQZ18267.1 serine/threonine protein kinase [Rhodococcus sp. 21391]UOT08206.1 serine/threonine protein kinase [Rhodococcus opacus]